MSTRPLATHPFKTDNTRLVAFLKCHGISPVSFRHMERRVFFFYDTKDACEKLRDEFTLGTTLNVNAREFSSRIDEAMTMVHQAS